MHAVVRMREWESRLVCRVMHRSAEGQKRPQRKLKRVGRINVTMTSPWRVLTNEVRLKSWDRSVFREAHKFRGREPQWVASRSNVATLETHGACSEACSREAHVAHLRSCKYRSRRCPARLEELR